MWHVMLSLTSPSTFCSILLRCFGHVPIRVRTAHIDDWKQVILLVYTGSKQRERKRGTQIPVKLLT